MLHAARFLTSLSVVTPPALSQEVAVTTEFTSDSPIGTASAAASKASPSPAKAKAKLAVKDAKLSKMEQFVAPPIRGEGEVPGVARPWREAVELAQEEAAKQVLSWRQSPFDWFLPADMRQLGLGRGVVSFFAQLRMLARCFLVCALLVTPSIVLYRWTNHAYGVRAGSPINHTNQPRSNLRTFSNRVPLTDARAPRPQTYNGGIATLAQISLGVFFVPGGSGGSTGAGEKRVFLVSRDYAVIGASALDALAVLCFFFYAFRRRSEARLRPRPERATVGPYSAMLFGFDSGLEASDQLAHELKLFCEAVVKKPGSVADVVMVVNRREPLRFAGESWWRAALRGSSTVLSLFRTYEAARAERHEWAATAARMRARMPFAARAFCGLGLEWGVPLLFPAAARQVERLVKKARRCATAAEPRFCFLFCHPHPRFSSA